MFRPLKFPTSDLSSILEKSESRSRCQKKIEVKYSVSLTAPAQRNLQWSNSQKNGIEKKFVYLHKQPEVKYSALTVGKILVDNYNPGGRMTKLNWANTITSIPKTEQKCFQSRHEDENGYFTHSKIFTDSRGSVWVNPRIGLDLLSSAYKTKAKKVKESGCKIKKTQSVIMSVNVSRRNSLDWEKPPEMSEVDFDMSFDDLIPRLNFNGTADNRKSLSKTEENTEERFESWSIPSSTYAKSSENPNYFFVKKSIVHLDWEVHTNIGLKNITDVSSRIDYFIKIFLFNSSYSRNYNYS